MRFLDLRVKNIRVPEQRPERLLRAARRPRLALGEHSHTNAVVCFSFCHF